MQQINLKRISITLSIALIIGGLFFLDWHNKKEAEILHQKLLMEKQAAQDLAKKNYLMGKFDPAQTENFVLVPQKYSVNVLPMYIRSEALKAFVEMEASAAKDNIELKIASATRNFDSQKNLWDSRWAGLLPVNQQNLAKKYPDPFQRFKKNLEYTALPGTSRHHWGTDIDINGANLAYFETVKGMREYNWLLQNAKTYGFCQPYKPKGVDRQTGYSEEKWHWSYLPLSGTFTTEYINLVKSEDINGFQGDQYATKQDIVNDYVSSIRPDCI